MEVHIISPSSTLSLEFEIFFQSANRSILPLPVNLPPQPPYLHIPCSGNKNQVHPSSPLDQFAKGCFTWITRKRNLYPFFIVHVKNEHVELDEFVYVCYVLDKFIKFDCLRYKSKISSEEDPSHLYHKLI
ncbi:hypothetical protein AMTRI_Chr08g202910 [Amborella trichopoda]